MTNAASHCDKENYAECERTWDIAGRGDCNSNVMRSDIGTPAQEDLKITTGNYHPIQGL